MTSGMIAVPVRRIGQMLIAIVALAFLKSVAILFCL